MERCEHYTLDCKQEKMTCEGCAYNKSRTTSLKNNENEIKERKNKDE